MRYRIWEAKTSEDIEKAASVVASAYTNYHVTKTSFPHRIRRHPHWRTFMISNGDEDLAHIGIVTFRIRIGRVKLLCAGLAWVGTHALHVKKGMASRLMEDVLTRLTQIN